MFKKALLLSTVLLTTGCDQLQRIGDVPVGKGAAAMELCSKVFISEQPEEKVVKDYVYPRVTPLQIIMWHHLDYFNKTAVVGTNYIYSDTPAVAVYREGIGCTLLMEDTDTAALMSQELELLPAPQLPAEPWPYGSTGVTDAVPTEVDLEKIDQAFDRAFSTAGEIPMVAKRNTTATLVAYKGKLIAERYGDGYGPETRQLGWSMSKSLTALLFGIAQDQGLLNANDPVLYDEWINDDRAAITFNNLLQMSSGLKFTEGYLGESDVTNMLFLSENQAEYAASLPLLHEPNTVFNYATGTTVMLADAITEAAGGGLNNGYQFYQSELFHKVDIASGIIGHDVSGTFGGGSYAYLTPRDWARLGQLILQKGRWGNEQVISEAWIDYMLTPADTTEFYGGQVWFASTDSYPQGFAYFSGNQAQFVGIFPELELLIVRMGVTQSIGSGIGQLIEDVLAAIEIEE